jgi:hypothetical protein
VAVNPTTVQGPPSPFRLPRTRATLIFPLPAKEQHTHQCPNQLQYGFFFIKPKWKKGAYSLLSQSSTSSSPTGTEHAGIFKNRIVAAPIALHQ